MRLKGKWYTIFKACWLGASISLLHLGLGACLPRGCYIAEVELLPFMYLLSFPGGLIVTAFVASLDLLPSMDFPVYWLLAFCGGYLQWFWLIPKISSRPEMVTLCLSPPRLPANEVAACPLTKKADVKGRRKPSRRILHFDKHGLTPLERALRINRNREYS